MKAAFPQVVLAILVFASGASRCWADDRPSALTEAALQLWLKLETDDKDDKTVVKHLKKAGIAFKADAQALKRLAAADVPEAVLDAVREANVREVPRTKIGQTRQEIKNMQDLSAHCEKIISHYRLAAARFMGNADLQRTLQLYQLAATSAAFAEQARLDAEKWKKKGQVVKKKIDELEDELLNK